MSDRSRLQINNSSKKKLRTAAEQTSPTDNLPDALQRVKDNNYPILKTGDMLHIQQAAGNKALRNLVDQRFIGQEHATVMRHSIPKSRHGVGEDEDVIQTLPAEQNLQKHSIPDGRRGTGEDEDEIQAKPMIQRAPGFGWSSQPRRATSSLLWGDGRSVAVQRKNGKGDAGVKEAGPKGEGAKAVDPKAAPAVKKEVKAEDPAVKQAEEEYKKFISAGPYRINPYVPDQVDDFGKFETIYDPANRTLTADMRVKFTFPDLPIPKGDTFFEKSSASMVKVIQVNYIANFIGQVHRGWSNRFTFRNVREPQSVWGKLNPITVKVNVHPVESNQHYLLKGYFKKSDTANVTSNTPGKENPSPSTLSLFKGDLDPLTQSFTGNPTTGADEVDRLEWNLPRIHFSNSSTAIDSKYLPDLQYVSDYLRQMNRPKFNIQIVGHASKTGDEANNIKYSARRAQSVLDKMKALGVTNHKLTAVGVGSKGASENGSWRKVDFAITVDKSFNNIQDTTVHEFGHMLGLDDEYVRKADTRTHTTQKEFMAKMLGSKLYGKGNEGKLGEEVTSVLPWRSASVMESGNEVRPYHYVTLWQALYDTAAKSPNQPSPAFTWKDWKVN